MTLVELSLLSVPSGEAFLRVAGPAFEAYGNGDHEDALATFMIVVSGFPRPRCRARLDRRLPGAVPQAIKDADTSFGPEIPVLAAWTFRPEQAAAIDWPVLSMLGAQTQRPWLEVIERPVPVGRAMSEFLGRNFIASVNSSRSQPPGVTSGGSPASARWMDGRQ